MPTPEIYRELEQRGELRAKIALESKAKTAKTAKELAEVVELGKGIVSTLREKKKWGKDSKEEMKE